MSLHDPSQYRLSTVVVGTDFTDAAANALERACELARAHGARLIIGHAMTLQPPPAGGPKLMNLPVDFEAKVRSASLDALDAIVEGVREQDLDASGELVSGHPARSLVRLAKENDADLVVAGTRGATGLSHLVLGSTAEQLVQHAHCPVLSVHPNDTRALDEVKRVLIPTDYSRDADLAAGVLGELLGHRAKTIELVLLHAYHLPAGANQLLGYYPIDDAIVASARGEALRALEPAAARLQERGFRTDVQAVSGYPPDVIVGLADGREVDMIAMGTRGLSGLRGALVGSTAKRVVQHASCPVLTVARPPE